MILKTPARPSSVLWTACTGTAALLACLAPGFASADQGLIPYAAAIPREAESDAITFGVFQVERYDSNFFRLPDNVDPSDGSRRSSITSVTGVGLNLDKAYGLQRIVVNASTSREFYSSHGGLDDTGSRLDSIVYWSLTPQLTGKVIFDYTRTPTDYEYLGFVTSPNPRTSRLTRLDVDFKPGATLHPRVSVFESRDTSQDTTFQLQNSRSTGGEAALLYDFASGNTIGVFANRSKGRDLNNDQTVFPQGSAFFVQGNQDFHQTEYGVLAEWKTTGQTTFTGRVGGRSYVGESNSAADFNGAVASLSYKYAITGKTSLQLEATRNLFSSQTTFSTYVQDDSLLARLDWDLTGKLRFRPSFAYHRQDYKKSPTPNATRLTENTRYATLQLDWAVLRALDVSFAVARSSRTATLGSLQYVDNNASLFARFKF